ncbi:hypothetical protein [Thiospirochaeta perfilievii]|uniref:hypothetical protein n=1 Tax=Thiospirochaeta perfilievii TaxID=252967 RepID=UPI001CA81AC7|nr:hypothetical protein [Thiospirochaeta perfilievii]
MNTKKKPIIVVLILIMLSGCNTGNTNFDEKTPNITGMESSATQLGSKMSLGWNVGNSLEAIGGRLLGETLK